MRYPCDYRIRFSGVLLRLTWRCGQSVVLLWAVLAVSACGGRDGCSGKRDGAATATAAAPGAGVAIAPRSAPPATSPEPADQPEDAEPAAKPWVMPSPEELAVKAAVIENIITDTKPSG